jgi:3',5'-cyclic AMP phosphodiesterase CpdA
MILVQLSDLHVRPEGRAANRMVESNMLAERALIAVRAMRPRPDAVVISGDLADCGLPSEYAVLAAMLRRQLDGMPVYPVVGNHDRRDNFRAGLARFPGVTDHPHFVQYTVEDLPVRLVLLDSVVEGSGHGELCPARLAWLDETLAAAPRRPTMIVLHHPPILCGIAALDRINLRSAALLAEVLARHPQVERLLCGHHHRAMVGRLGHTIVSTAPTVAHAVEFALVHALDRFVMEPPAFSVHMRLPDGQITTHTVFVESYPGPYPYIEDPEYPAEPA